MVKNYKKPLEMCRENVYYRVTDEKIKRGNEDAGDDDGFPS